MTTQTVKPKFTYEDYCNTPDDERYELLDGELVMVPAPRTTHQFVKGEIFTALHSHAREHSLGHILDAPTDVVLSDTVVLQPDILFVSAERAHIITEANVQARPTWWWKCSRHRPQSATRPPSARCTTGTA